VFYPVLLNGSQSINITSLRAATVYRIEVAVRSQAGQSAFSTPVQAQTTIGEIPQFSLTNDSCLSTSCLIQWLVEDNGDSVISKGEIYYAKVNFSCQEKTIYSNQSYLGS